MADPAVIIAPSILSADFARLGEEVRAIDEAGADWIHLDVMDGHYVPNITFGPEIIRAVRKYSDKFFDAHLMISPTDQYLEVFAKSGCDRITVHAEATIHLDRTLQAIGGLGVKAGVALNPATQASAIDFVLDRVDLVLVMTVNPGFGGQAFIPEMTEKIKVIKKMIGERPITIQADGGITPKTVGAVAAAGATAFVAGSAVFGRPPYADAIAAIRDAATRNENVSAT